MDKLHHLFERGAGEKDFVHAFAFHGCGIVMRNCSPAAAEHRDVVCAFFAQKIDYGCKELDVPTVITGDANSTHILLDCRAHDIADRAVVTEINHFDTVPDEFQVDRIDRAIVPVANRDSGQDSNRRSHLKIEKLMFRQNEHNAQNCFATHSVNFAYSVLQ